MIDYTSYLRQIIADVAVVCPEFSHIRTESLIVTFSRAKSSGKGGLLAFLAPLRFEGGVTVTSIRGKLYQIPTVVVDGQTKLYYIGFVVPRFLDLPLEEKVKTIIHELYHVSEAFDGDIRRFPGRNFAHSSRRSTFDSISEKIAKEWLSKTSIDTGILSQTSEELKRNFGKVAGVRVSKPKIVRLS
ncbi:MAG TPA: hypothetical protein PL190_00925 [Caldisericia bacterium]|nr:MAG: hypothetical protein BWX90_00540 [bacterium ADurb.Bin132]HNW31610.1 hypothetical protein [Caldisericia bacterium]HNY61700.1 hypothetical protein [Caldisericia bacterium]HOC80040.1 hypothetical protein [Caldisericia bacterium]HOG70700.1 hypothetical protein [Caldisericia bacterium]